ncbi:MAG: alpha/beta hydrolase [Spirochaetia bacterium]|nr:alpha/beta hydrolase [Spirochaetia bacterium]
MSNYEVHQDYKDLTINIPMNRWLLPFLRGMTRMLYKKQGIGSDIEHHTIKISSYRGYKLPIEIFSPVAMRGEAPCVLYMHGGAFTIPATDFHKKLMCDYALHASCRVVFVDYRLAPEYPYPYALEDCYTAYEWIVVNSVALGFDTEKIGLCGDSAGGALAAALAQVIRDRGAKKPFFQMLIYPVTDSRMKTESMKLFVDTPIWNQKKNKKMWELYLRGTAGQEGTDYSSPMEAESLKGLSPAFIEVSEFDCLRDEGIAYFEALKQAGVDAVLNRTEGTIHGFELNYESEYTQSIIAKRIKFMNDSFVVS